MTFGMRIGALFIAAVLRSFAESMPTRTGAIARSFDCDLKANFKSAMRKDPASLD
jgi:hypothetical protein